MEFKIGDTVKVRNEYLEETKHTCGFDQSSENYLNEKAVIVDIGADTIYLEFENKSKRLSCAWSKENLELIESASTTNQEANIEKFEDRLSYKILRTNEQIDSAKTEYETQLKQFGFTECITREIAKIQILEAKLEAYENMLDEFGNIFSRGTLEDGDTE